MTDNLSDMAALLNLVLPSPELAPLTLVGLVWLVGVITGLLRSMNGCELRNADKDWREADEKRRQSALDAHYREWHAYQVREDHRMHERSVDRL